MLTRTPASAVALLLLWTIVLPNSISASSEVPKSDEGAKDAVRVLELAVSDRIETDGTLTRRQRQKVEILTAAGVAGYSQVGVPFLEANQEAKLETLKVRKPGGQELDLASSAPTDVAPVYPLSLPIYSDLRVLRAAVPALEVGDTLEFETRVLVKPLAEGEVWTEAAFASREDVGRQVYELDLPADSRIDVHVLPGFEARTEEEKKNGRWIRRWVYEQRVAGDGSAALDTKARASRKSEEELAREATPEIQVSSFDTWTNFGRWWSSLAPPIVDDAVRKKAEELTAGLATRKEKLAAVHRFAAEGIRYLSLPLGIGRFQAREPEVILRTGLGDCKDKVRLLRSLARALGIEVEPVLVAASSKRMLVEEVPSPMQFDHVIARARIEGETIWLDPTSEMTPTGRLPASVRGKRGVALTAKKSGDGSDEVVAEIVSTPSGKERLDSRTETVGSIDENGMIRAKVRRTYEGDIEAFRLTFKYADEPTQKKLVEGLSSEWDDDGSEVVDWAHSEPSDLDYPFWMEYDVEWPMTSSVWKKAWTLWVPLPRFEIDAPPDAAEGQAEAAEFVELDEGRQAQVARIELPEGVDATAPVPISASRDFADFRSNYRVEGRTLVIERELSIRAGLLPREKFGELRQLRELIRKDRGQEFDLAPAPAVAARAAPTAAELLDECARLYADGQYLAAEPSCRKAVELEPSHRYGWSDLGRTLQRIGRLDEAEVALRKQIEINPESDVAYTNLAHVYWRKHNYPEAEKLLRKQIEIAPLEASAHASLGRLLRIVQKYDESYLELQRALKLEPGDAETLSDLIRLEAVRERSAEVRALIAAHPELPSEYEDRVQVAQSLLWTGGKDWPVLRDWFERLAADSQARLEGYSLQAPTTDSLTALAGLHSGWEGVGRAALEQGHTKEGLDLLESALRLGGAPSAAVARSEALRASGDSVGANLQLAVAIDLARPQAARLESQLQTRVPATEERKKLLLSGSEESFRLRSLTCDLPSAAGAQGELWVTFGPNGRIEHARTVRAGGPEKLATNLARCPVQLPFPADNRARVPMKVLAYCSAEGACTLNLERPSQTFHGLRSTGGSPGR